ncbi:hypothetical protein QFC19_004825 [Naganishia cerealis]|uniref:Uncharacterized protein n=1 Tax=Naganishia cerealis TaxID=610337 RepID=A0ACC2VSE3_9TREE|nr:hypothetical protein QFC19_004825 [Naganishia cerealis]
MASNNDYNAPSGIAALFQELEQLFHDNVPENLHDLPHRIFDSIDKLTGEVYGPKAISVPAKPPSPPPSFYDKLSKYTSDHPYIVTTSVLGAAALSVSIGYSLQDEDSFLCVTGRWLINMRRPIAKSGRDGYKLGTVPRAKDADELERKVKANDKVKAKGLGVAFRVLVYDPADVSIRKNEHPSLGMGGRLPAIPSFVHPPLKNSAGQVIERAGEDKRMLARSATRNLPSLISLHHTMGLLPIPSNFAEQLLTSTNLLLAKNVGITNPSMAITNVGIGEIDYYSSIVAHSFSQAPHATEPGVMRFLSPIWAALKMALGFVGIGQEAKDWKVIEQKLLRIVKHKRSGLHHVGCQSELIKCTRKKVCAEGE